MKPCAAKKKEKNLHHQFRGGGFFYMCALRGTFTIGIFSFFSLSFFFFFSFFFFM